MKITILFFQLIALILFLAAHFIISIYYYSEDISLRGWTDMAFIPAIILQITTIIMGVKEYGSK